MYIVHSVGHCKKLCCNVGKCLTLSNIERGHVGEGGGLSGGGMS